MQLTLKNLSLAVTSAGVLLISGCGGGGGANSAANTTSTANLNIGTTTSYRHQNNPAPTDVGTLLHQANLPGYYFDSRQYVDLDGDGVKEIVVAPGLDSVNGSPVHVYKKQTDGSYADATNSFFGTAVPSQIHPRKAIAADFNGDGLLDLYFADHGYDHSPFPGAQNVLMLSNKATQKLEQKTIPNNPTAFHHCATAGDIDNNGTVDIFVCADGYQGSSKMPYFLLNDSLGNMTISRTGIPASLNQGVLAAELIDVDNDGYLDLVASSRSSRGGIESFNSTIFWGDGSGSFTDSRATTLPNPNTFVATYDIKAEDIDGDGRRDLVLLRVTKDLAGYYLQTLRQTSARVFADESVTRIIKNETTWEGNGAAWFPWIHLTDLNNDGKLDIAIGDSSSNIPSRNFQWINNGAGIFSKAP